MVIGTAETARQERMDWRTRAVLSNHVDTHSVVDREKYIQASHDVENSSKENELENSMSLSQRDNLVRSARAANIVTYLATVEPHY